MGRKIILSVLIFLISSIAFCKDSITFKCSTKICNDTLNINISITNHLISSVYLPITHWEFNGVSWGSEFLFGYPKTHYIVNSIIFYPNDNKKYFITKLEKDDFPDYDYFPILIKLNTKEEKSINLRIIDRDLKPLKENPFLLRLFFNYATDEGFSQILSKNDEVNKYNLINGRKTVDIELKDKIRNITGAFFELEFSQLPVKYTNSRRIRDVFSNKIYCNCEIK